MLLPSSHSKSISQGRNLRENRWQAASHHTLVSVSAYYLTLKIEAKFSSKNSVGFQLTTQCYVPENVTLLNPCSENQKSYEETYVEKSVKDLMISKFRVNLL
jgi:hypothetical protein